MQNGLIDPDAVWLWSRMGPRSMCYTGLQIGATWRIRLNRLSAAAMRHFCQITLTACYFCHTFNVFDS